MDEKTRRSLCCGLLLCLLAWPAARAEEATCEPGLRLLDNVIAEGLLLSTESGSAAERFQFRYHRSVFVAPERPSYSVAVVERDGDRTAAMLCMRDGVPYAHLVDDTLRCAAGPARKELLAMSGAAMRFRASNIAEALKAHSLTNKITRSTVRLDLAGILGDVRAELQPLAYEPRTRRLALRKENGSTAFVRFPREKAPRAFPIAGVLLRNADGEFVAITDIIAHDEPCLRISRPYPNLEKMAPTLTVEAVIDQYGSFWEAVGWVMDERANADWACSLPQYILGAAMLRLMPVREDLTADERELIENAIKALHPRMAGYVVGDAWTQAFRDLQEVVQRKVVEPANLVDPQPGAVVRYVTGRDRHRTAASLEACLWVSRTKRLYSLLAEIAVNRGMSDEQRAMALDLIGEIGTPELCNGLTEVSDALENELPPLVRLALASAKARTGVPTDDDVKLLRESAADDATPDRWRAVWLESLLLTDEAEGLQGVIADVLGRALGQERDEHARRCLLAAGCSDDGRELLLRLARGDGKGPPPMELMRVLSTAIAPGDRQWDDWLERARQLAVDETLDADGRWIAADVAARATTPPTQPED
jgi:hypothetical protein